MKDLKLTENGELVINSETGDFDYVYGDECVAQQIMFRMKTQKGDYMMFPEVGASLEDFIGKDISERTLVQIEERVLEEVLKVPQADIRSIAALRISENTVAITIDLNSIENNKANFYLAYILDMGSGLIQSRPLEYSR